MSAAFQPDLPQEGIQLCERCLCFHLQIQPEDRRVGVLYPQMKEVRRFSLGRLVVSGATLEVAAHRRLGGAFTAKSASSVRSELCHGDYSIALLHHVLCQAIGVSDPHERLFVKKCGGRWDLPVYYRYANFVEYPFHALR